MGQDRSNSATLQRHVGIDNEYDFTRAVLQCHIDGRNLAAPDWKPNSCVNHPFGAQLLDDLPHAIGGPVIDDDDLVRLN